MQDHLIITLSPNERAALEAKAAQSGKEPEAIIHEIIARELDLPVSEEPINRPMTSQEFMEQQYREGKSINIPTREPLTEEEKARREQLAKLLAGGKPLSEMVIEDRGPY